MNPYQPGDRVALISIDSQGMRADRAVVRGVDGMDVHISPANDRAAHALTTVTVNNDGWATNLEPLTPAMEADMGNRGYAVYPFAAQADIAEIEELERKMSQDLGRDYGHGF